MIDPTALHYPVSSQKEFESHEDFSSTVEVPQVNITSIMGNDNEKGKSIAHESANKPAAIEDAPGDGLAMHTESSPNDDGADGTPHEQDSARIFPDFSENAPGSASVFDRQRIRSQKHPAACPNCGEKSLYRSHSRSVIEGIRKKVTDRRIYRCHNCEWRGWLRKHS